VIPTVTTVPDPAAADPAVAEAQTADAVAAAVLTCPAVAGLHAGGVGHRTVTYLPRRRVEGVHVDDDRFAVAVVAVEGIPMAVLADQVRTAVAPLAAGRPVDVHVADLRRFDTLPPALPSGPSA
jgi:hypothetical protein